MSEEPGSRPPEPHWERTVLEKLAFAMITEQRRARRWGIFFRLVGIAFAGAVLAVALGLWTLDPDRVTTGRHTAMIEVKGVIAGEGDASARLIVAGLRAAFEDTRTAGVVLRISSPGGSPVQAGIVHDEILRLRATRPAIPVHAVVEEVCASGAYYVAVAADRIYVDKASLVGSIGVLLEGFGFVGAMEKLGIERRLLTAGQDKGFLDSFSPLSEKHRQYAQTMLDEIHRQFIDIVRNGRGERLKGGSDLFSGLVWSGARAIELGLADALGTVDSVAREVIRAEHVVDFTRHENLAERLAKRLGASAGQALGRQLGALDADPQLR